MNPQEQIRYLQQQLNDIEKQLRALQRLDVNPPPSSVLTYSGTPTAGQIAYFPGAGTAAGGSVTYSHSSGTPTFSASGAAGYRFHDDGGNLAVSVVDGGGVGLRTSAPHTTTDMQLSSSAFTNASVSVVAPAVASRAEILQTWGVSDSANLFILSNAATTNSRFQPNFLFRDLDGHQEQLTLVYETLPADDTGANPGIVMAAYTRTSAQAFAAFATRPILEIRNLSTVLARLEASGQLEVLVGPLAVGGLTSVGASQIGIKAGTSSNDAAVGGVLTVITTQTGNTLTGEDDLASYSVPANTLAVNGQSLWFEAWGTFAANSNSKTVRVRFGTTGTNLISTLTGVLNGGGWSVRGRIIRTGAATQKANGTAIASASGTADSDTVTGLDQTLSGAVTLKVTGEATATNDVVLESFIVGWNDNNT